MSLNTISKTIKKDPNKAFVQISGVLKKFSLEFIINIGVILKIESKVLSSIRSLLSDNTILEDLDKDVAFESIKVLFRIHQKIQRLNGKRKQVKTHIKSEYGGGDFFDGDYRRPINKSASKGIKRH